MRLAEFEYSARKRITIDDFAVPMLYLLVRSGNLQLHLTTFRLFHTSSIGKLPISNRESHLVSLRSYKSLNGNEDIAISENGSAIKRDRYHFGETE